MPNQLAVVLREPLAASASGTSTTVIDIGDRSLLELVLDAPLLSAGNVLSVSVETSLTGNGWTFLGRFDNLTAANGKQLTLPNVLRFVRVKWTLTGTAPLATTFGVSGIAHQLYCSIADVGRYGLPEPVLANYPPAVIADKVLAASDEAAGYLASAYTLPLVKWDADLRKHVAKMAAFDIMSFRGYAPDSGKDDLIRQGHNDAVGWLNRIAKGGLRPPGMIDTTPTVTEQQVYVVSGGRRWDWPGCR